MRRYWHVWLRRPLHSRTWFCCRAGAATDAALAAAPEGESQLQQWARNNPHRQLQQNSRGSDARSLQRHNYRLVLAYDGTQYGGFQLQQRGQPTIQWRLEQALCKLTCEPREALKVQGAGRTDAGVHARGQVAQFYAQRSIDAGTMRRALNGYLPPDIRVLEAAEAPLEFNCRYAISKTYHYELHTAPVADPFTIRYRHHPHYLNRLDPATLAAAARLFCGRHNFVNFSSVTGGGFRKDPVRTLTRFKVVPIDQGLRLEVQGDGFLYKQVRHMVGALLEVSTGRLPLDAIPEALAGGEGSRAPTRPNGRRDWSLAQAKGLCLHEVEYFKEWMVAPPLT